MSDTTTIDLRKEIQQALAGAWETFAAAHPRLAAVLDQGLLLDAAAQHFADDPDYQHALADANAAGKVAEEITAIVATLTQGWLEKLI